MDADVWGTPPEPVLVNEALVIKPAIFPAGILVGTVVEVLVNVNELTLAVLNLEVKSVRLVLMVEIWPVFAASVLRVPVATLMIFWLFILRDWLGRLVLSNE